MSELEEGRIFVEDLSDSVEVDLRYLKIKFSGLFTWSCFVLLKGELEDSGVFKVKKKKRICFCCLKNKTEGDKRGEEDN